MMLSERQLEIKINEIMNEKTRNTTFMDEALMRVKQKGLKNETLDQINHARLHKKFFLALELVGATGRSRTYTFDTKNSKSQLK